MIPWRMQYADPDADQILGEDTALYCDPSEDMTLQEYAEEADVNVMLRKFGVTGVLPVVDRKPFFADFSNIPDYQTALNMVKEMDAAFMQLPAEVRKAIDNDPARVEEWISNPENKEAALKMGLLEREPVVEPIPVRVLADAPVDAG